MQHDINGLVQERLNHRYLSIPLDNKMVPVAEVLSCDSQGPFILHHKNPCLLIIYGIHRQGISGHSFELLLPKLSVRSTRHVIFTINFITKSARIYIYIYIYILLLGVKFLWSKHRWLLCLFNKHLKKILSSLFCYVDVKSLLVSHATWLISLTHSKQMYALLHLNTAMKWSYVSCTRGVIPTYLRE